MSELTRPKLSRIVSSQLPEFIREDYGTFVTFLEAYYEFLNQNTVDDLYSIRDIDKTLDLFLDNFKNELAVNFPKAITDKRFLLHRIKDYYLSKGSDSSYKLLFKLLYNKEVEIDYPGKQVLRASDGKWNQEVSIFVRIDTGKPEDVVNKKISIYKDETKTPIKVFVQRFETPQTKIAELFIDRRYFGTINVGDKVKLGSFTATVLPTTVKFNVISPGTKFKLGQTFNVGIGDSTDSVVKVDKVSANGGLEKVSFIKYGTGYVYVDPYLVPSDEFRQIFDYTNILEDSGYIQGIDYNIPVGEIWESNKAFALGDYLYHGNNLYEVTVAGTTGTIPPEPTTGTITNGTVELTAIFDSYDSENYFDITESEYAIREQQTYGAAFSDDYVFGEAIRSWYFKEENNYIVPPETPPDKPKIQYDNDFIFTLSNAQKTIDILQSTTVLSGNSIGISDIETDVVEHGYVTTNDYNIDDGIIWEPNKQYSLGEYVYYDNRLYEVTVAGTTGTAIPTHTTGSDTNGTLTLSVVYSYYNTENYADSGYFEEFVRTYGSALDASYVGTVIRNFYHNNYTERDDLVALSGQPALVEVQIGAVAKYPGYYATNDGFLDDAIFIQDSKFYQSYSYVLKVDEKLETFKSVVKSLLHPVGMGLFAEYGITNNFDLGTTLEFIYKVYTIIRNEELVASEQILHKDVHKPVNEVQPIEEYHTYHLIQYPKEETIVSFDEGGYIGRDVYSTDLSGAYFLNDDGRYLENDLFRFYGYLANWALYSSSLSTEDYIQEINSDKIYQETLTVSDEGITKDYDKEYASSANVTDILLKREINSLQQDTLNAVSSGVVGLNSYVIPLTNIYFDSDYTEEIQNQF